VLACCCFVAGLLGEDCSVNASLPPVIIGSRTSPVCDARGPNPCTFVSLFLSNFAFIETFSSRFVRMTLQLADVDIQNYVNELLFPWPIQWPKFTNDVLIILQEIQLTGEVFFTEARLVSASEVHCYMPFSILDPWITWSNLTWILTVSNDNVTFSTPIFVFVFDSKCLDCTDDGSSCEQKVHFSWQFVDDSDK